ncbi:hypothetical protein FW800_25805 [Pseudomonas sp. 910_23]|uniref:hypothetical protein n=1 Tax=Pseudomonas sp. 910_23 TaxID=2604461 RepID=UPI0040634779
MINEIEFKGSNLQSLLERFSHMTEEDLVKRYHSYIMFAQEQQPTSIFWQEALVAIKGKLKTITTTN